jgi:FtsH-binding integral membrane protein
LAIGFAIAYSAYLLIDTQMILGNREKMVDLDDYLWGATKLYTDIISLFLKILEILGKRKDD